MGFWTNLLIGRGPEGIVPNQNGPISYEPGEEGALELVGDDIETRSMPFPAATPWSGWPANWDVPAWQVNSGINKLVDIAWACLDLNSNIVSAMPVYHLKDGGIIPPEKWMMNPDPNLYTCWQEFAKQLFWDFQMGEAFILPTVGGGNNGYPSRFRVMPPWLVTVDWDRGRRQYKIGSIDVTDEILHIRYQGNTTDTRGHGPLEIAGARSTTIGLLQRYASTLAETGGVPLYWLGIERRITPSEGKDLLDTWIQTRAENAGHPAILGSKATLNQSKTMSAKDMALMELSQFNESRIAILLGVPPFLVGLGGATGSLCVDTETEILTRTGWKRYDEVAIGDETLTLNQETGLAEWQPVLNVSTFDVVDRNMISMEMIGHSSFSTDDHQWPVIYKNKRNGKVRRRLRLTRDITATDALITAAPCVDQPQQAKYTDAFVELAAWWYTEGNVVAAGHGGHTAWLSQSEDANPDHCTRIRAVMHALFGPPSVTRNQGAGWSEYAYEQKNGKVICQWRMNRVASEALLGVMEDVKRKVLKREFIYQLTPAQLELFIQTSIWADGCESGFTSFKQSDDDRLEIFELACWLAGKTTQRHNRTQSVTVRRRQGIKPVDADYYARAAGRDPIVKAFKWTGRVWCPTTPNQTWFARRNGTQYFTHNTYSNVESLFDFHDRSSLRPKSKMVMDSLSGWALPSGRSAELNRDDYTRLPLDKRAAIYKQLGPIESGGIGVLTLDEIRIMERFYGSSAGVAAQALTGGAD